MNFVNLNTKILIRIKHLAKSNLFKGVLTYGIGDLIQKGISFLTMPIFSYYILPEELGLVANFDIMVQILSYIAFTSVVGNILYFYYDRDREQVALLVSNLMILFSIINVLAIICVFLFSNIAEKYLFLGIKFQLLAILLNEANLIHALNTMLYRLEDKPIPFISINLSYCFINIGLLFLYVIYLGLGGVGKIYSHCVVAFLFVAVDLLLLYRRHYFNFRWSNKCLKELLLFGVPLLPHSLAYWLKSGFDKILLTNFCGLAANGMYSMAISFGAVYTIFGNSFNNAYNPYIQKRITQITPENEKSEKRAIVIQTYEVIIGFFVLMIPLIGFCWLVIKYMLSAKYLDSFSFIPWIFLSLTLKTAYDQVVKFVYTEKKTIGLGIITLSCSIIQCLMTYFFLQIWGENGIKYSLVAGAFLIFVSVWIYSQKVYPMPWFSFFKKNVRGQKRRIN